MADARLRSARLAGAPPGATAGPKPQGGAKAAAKRAPKAATKASKAGAASKAIARKPKSKAKAGIAKAGAAGAGPTRTDEAALWASGVQSIAGVDEAGRGPLAGPVVAAACVLPRDERWEVPEGLDDSKQMSEAARERVYEELMADDRVIKSVSIVSAATIDEINILQATLKGMKDATAALSPPAEYALIDGNKVPEDMESAAAKGAHAVIKGDARCLNIAAASVLAKVTRDRLLVEMDVRWPQYGFAQHKGYPTAAHRAALAKHGACEEHRRSYAPVAQALARRSSGE